MDSETLNCLEARLSAIEMVATLLLSETLQRLSPSDRLTLEMAMGLQVPMPHARDLSTADDVAGRAMECERTLRSILRAAKSAAGLTGEAD